MLSTLGYNEQNHWQLLDLMELTFTGRRNREVKIQTSETCSILAGDKFFEETNKKGNYELG